MSSFIYSDASLLNFIFTVSSIKYVMGPCYKANFGVLIDTSRDITLKLNWGVYFLAFLISSYFRLILNNRDMQNTHSGGQLGCDRLRYPSAPCSTTISYRPRIYECFIKHCKWLDNTDEV